MQQLDDESERTPVPLSTCPPEPSIIQKQNCSLDAMHESQKNDSRDSEMSILAGRPCRYSPAPYSSEEEDSVASNSSQKHGTHFQGIHIDEDVRLQMSSATPYQLSRPSNSSTVAVTTPAQSQQADTSFIVPAICHIKSNLEESHKSIYVLNEEIKALTSENAKYEAQLHDMRLTAKQQETVMIDKEEQWSAAISILETEKKALENERATLQDEIKALRYSKDQLAAVAKERAKIQRKLDATTSDLKQTSTAIESLLSEKEKLVVQLEEATERANAAESQCMLTMSQVQDLQKAIEQLQAQVRDNELLYFEIQQENGFLKSSLCDIESKHAAESSQATLAASELQQKLAAMSKTFDQSAITKKALEAELDTLREAVVENGQSRVEAASQTIIECEDAGVQTAPVTINNATQWIRTSRSFASANDTTGYAERLGRIRDAAERATIIEEVRREVSRLKTEHETQLHTLEQQHDAAMRRVIQDAKAELRSKTQKHKELLKNEFDSKLDALEKRHQAELDEAKEEVERTIRVSDETVMAAMAEVETAAQQFEAEHFRANELEKKLSSTDLARKEELHIAEMALVKEDWQTETANLMERIRTACNTVLEEHLAKQTNGELLAHGSKFSTANHYPAAISSPVSVNDPVTMWSSPINASTFDQNGRRSFGDQNVFRPMTNGPSLMSKPSLLAISSSNLDQALADTEAIVMDMLSK
ncbi:hypothetical protein MPSEU_000473800 [Mayamaea pseudoterrestris]|nr:hypothetical protein MPSEU_000473800 [Mayamaea pseudoterrestris]